MILSRSANISSLLRPKDIRSVYAAQSLSVNGSRVFYRENGLNRIRVLISPVRKFGNAVERNRVKRLVREVIRNHAGKIRSGYDLAVRVYPGNFAYKEREQQFLRLLRRTPVFVRE